MKKSKITEYVREGAIFTIESLVYDNYDENLKAIFEHIESDFKVRETEVGVKIGDKIYKMPYKNLLTSLILWYPFGKLNLEFRDEFIFNFSEKVVKNDELNAYFDAMIDYLRYKGADKDDINDCLASMIENLGLESDKYNIFIGETINLYSLMMLAHKNKELNDLFHLDLEEGTPYNEIEEIMETTTKDILRILGNNDNCLRTYIECQEGLNKNQFTQLAATVGLKPDIDGNVYPLTINTSILRGLKRVSDYFIEAAGGRKASIINHSQVKKSGYLMRKLSLLCMNTLLGDELDCGTSKLMVIEVKDKKTLQRLDGRYYKNAEGELELLVASECSDLIGKTIELRSPITCKGHDGKVCHTCYGNLSEINKDIHIGLLGIMILTAQLTQSMLSAKHLLKTNSEVIDWGEDFLKYFSVDGNRINISDDEKFNILLDDDCFVEEENFSDDDLSIKNIKKFKILTKNKEIEIESPKMLFLSDTFEELLSKAKKNGEELEVSLRNVDVTDTLFYFEIGNLELSSHLNNIVNLIDNKDHLDVNNKEDMFAMFLELLNHSNFKLNSVHAELIIRELIRKTTDLMRRPDFEKDEEYTILRVTDAILNSPSLAISLSFEQLKKQLYNPNTFKKQDTSLLDRLF